MSDTFVVESEVMRNRGAKETHLVLAHDEAGTTLACADGVSWHLRYEGVVGRLGLEPASGLHGRDVREDWHGSPGRAGGVGRDDAGVGAASVDLIDSDAHEDNTRVRGMWQAHCHGCEYSMVKTPVSSAPSRG